MNRESKIPVLVLAFNRPDHVVKAMEPIKRYKPSKLYLECDGPRICKYGESEAVELCKKEMLGMIDWQCKVKTLFRDENLGCAKAVSNAISWFFENEEYGVIIEDDVIVGDDFFRLCEELLPRYVDENKVMEISARNESGRTDINNTYVYAQCYHCWGWATWRRAWLKMDMSMSAAPELSLFYLIRRLGVFRGIMMKNYFVSAFRSLPYFNSWATRWYLSILAHDGLVICPGINLSLNIGMNGGVHYEKNGIDPYANLRIEAFNWPIVYNDGIMPDKKQKRKDSRTFFRVRLLGIINKLKRYIQ